ncbi:YesN/AraC family two-component response regulator [Pullulanibacillus pueri]|uniref:HTH araC/xylS-type domain-containing protein n=1 Tax=Pullulanibacillus pueri TaxID=1437324 RepID=A0A8J3ENK2_9BACL|nr:helix-turn-helix domain-containing protein [Pullulanibacillus pueri]MBM7683317.1 YesN/AraC family two-component response regulator [Pullulanibacillus pueri]GGH86409.1 hypothetical protein GCM10007096_34050 [Pullulanibacillus pueri]
MGFTSLFKNFFVSYIIILLLPLITGFFSYQVSINLAEKSSIESSLSILNQSKKVLEQRLSEVGSFTRQLALNNDAIELLDQNDLNNNSRVFRSWKVSQDLSSYAATNDYLQDCFLYIKRQQIVITPKSVFYRLRQFYELNEYQNLSYSNWIKTILENKHQNDIIPLRGQGKHTVIAYVQSLPLNNFNKPMGTVVVQINSGKITSLLKNVTQQYKGGWAYVADQDGQILATSGISKKKISALNIQSQNNDGETHRYLDNKSLLITTQSDTNGWHYVAGIPKKALMKNANSIKKISWTVTTITLVIGFFICLWLALRNSGPIHSLVMTIKEQLDPEGERSASDYDFLQGNIANLISKNTSLQHELEGQLPILREVFLSRLIYGDFRSDTEIKPAAVQANLNIPERGYVGILHINGYGDMGSTEIYNELSATRLLLKKRLEQMNLELFVRDLQSDQLIIIFPISEEETKESSKVLIEEQVQALGVFVEKNYRITFTVAMGGVFQSFSDVSQSFNQAIRVLEYTLLTNGYGVLWYERVAEKTDMYEYTIDQELRLMNAVKMGESIQAKQILAQVFKQNFLQNTLSVDMALQLIDEIKATFLKAFSNLNKELDSVEKLKQQVNGIRLADGLEHIRKILEKVIDQFCLLIVNKRSETDNEIVQEILNYLNDYYCDPDMSLYQVAEKVGRPEKFVSQLFKKQTGTYLMERLEKIRIKKASELLVNTDKTIEIISCEVGYNSPHSFRRAFKRLLDVTPNQYRKSIRERDCESS